MNKFIYFLLLFQFFLSSCNLFKDCPEGEIQFDLPVEVTGHADTLYIGDTLHIKMEFSDMIPERNTDIEYEFTDYNFRLMMYFAKIDTNPVIIYNPDVHFSWAALNGSIENSGEFYYVYPEYSNNRYIFELRAITKARGLYAFGINSIFGNTIPLEKLDNGPCSRRPVGVFTKLTDETNNNFEFMKNSPDPSQSKMDYTRFQEFAGFCFYVK